MSGFLVGSLIGFAAVALLMATAPWWAPLVDPFMDRWSDWVDRKIKERGF